MANYKPQSYFLTDYNKLEDNNQISDAFGPVKDFETTKFRITSFVRLKNTYTTGEVYSINDGHIAIFPGGTDKLNIVIKNTGTYDPLNIKYFVYRGIKKSDLINNDGNIVPYVSNSQPKILESLWGNFNLNNPGITVFPASLLGYDSTTGSDELLLDQFLLNNKDYKCNKGTYIGNFTEKLGLDIVIDEGEYILEKQQTLFKFNVAYAKSEDFIFDVNGLNALQAKRYKEYIHQFLDAAAFWGSHIRDGEIFINSTTGFNTINEIYNQFLNKYFTKNRMYIYIRNEKNRSFNYYAAKTVLGFENETPPDPNRNYSTYGWPILYNKQSLPLNNLPPNERESDQSTFPKYGAKIELECRVANNGIGEFPNGTYKGDYKNEIIPRDQFLAIYSWTDNEKIFSHTLEDGFDGPAGSSILTYDFYIKYYAKGNDVCSNFLVYSTNLEQNFPLDNYYDNLWVPNINTPFTNTPTTPKAYKASYCKNLIVNLKDTLKIGAIIQQDVIFDTGGNGKKRRLYVTSIKRNYSEKESFNKSLNIDKKPPMNTPLNLNSVVNYSNFLYGNNDFSIYRGSFLDNTDTVYSLSLVSQKNHWLKNSYLHLGITNDDYNKIFSSANAASFNVSDNFFFCLEEVLFADDHVRKFKLGVKYENGAGTVETYYPATTIDIYTLDGMFFFSKDYSSSQDPQLCDEFSSKTIAHFRPLPAWKGEFGFDWVRIGDSGTKGDTTGSGGKPDRTYKSVIGNYYRDALSKIKKEYKVGGPAVFRKEKNQYQSFINYNYFSYPAHVDSLYTSSRLTLYPAKTQNGTALNYPKIRGAEKSCLIEGSINLKVKITDTISKLSIQFDKNIFEISTVDTNDLDKTYSDDKYTYIDIKGLNPTVSRTISLTIKCIKESNTDSKIRVISTENGLNKIAGEMIMYSNVERKKIKLVFVKCKTNLTGSDKEFSFVQLGNPLFNKHLYKLERFLNHSLIEIVDGTTGANSEPKINSLDLRSSATGGYSTFNTDWGKDDGAGNMVIDMRKQINNESIMTYMKNKAKTLLSLPTDHFIIIAINENTDLDGNEVFGAAETLIPTYSLSLFRQGFYYISDVNKSTFVLGHEFYHGLNCKHTFSYDDKNHFVEKFSLTDNIMDYGHSNSDEIEATSIWWYQRNFARRAPNGLLLN